jgi:Fe-S-cluster containining protein
VSLTTLEALALLDGLPAADAERLARMSDGRAGLRPSTEIVTTNALAELCAQGVEPPEPPERPLTACPLLAGDLCSIYPLRPFNCRCFVSRVTCSTGAAAEVDDEILAVNTLFLQTIEHLDAGGCTGYLPDVLRVLADPLRRQAYCDGSPACREAGLAPNRPLRVLMVPPEHGARIQRLIERLRDIRV